MLTTGTRLSRSLRNTFRASELKKRTNTQSTLKPPVQGKIIDMKKTKTTTTSKVMTKGEFNALIDDIATLQLRYDSLVLMRDQAQHQLNALHEPGIKEVEDAIKAKLKSAAKYAKAERKDLLEGSGRQDASPLADYGFRIAPAELTPLPKWTWAQVSTALVQQGLDKYLRRPEPEVDKQTIKAALLSADELAEFGCRVTQKVDFWVTAKTDAATRLKAE